jgi:hypothetical protein
MAQVRDRQLEGPGSQRRMVDVQARFRRVSMRDDGWDRLRRALRWLVPAYLVVCVTIIAVGIDRRYPELRGRLTDKIVSRYGERPYPSMRISKSFTDRPMGPA